MCFFLILLSIHEHHKSVQLTLHIKSNSLEQSKIDLGRRSLRFRFWFFIALSFSTQSCLFSSVFWQNSYRYLKIKCIYVKVFPGSQRLDFFWTEINRNFTSKFQLNRLRPIRGLQNIHLPNNPQLWQITKRIQWQSKKGAKDLKWKLFHIIKYTIKRHKIRVLNLVVAYEPFKTSTY